MQDPSETVLGGKYRLVHQLGRGGMGSVWLAKHLTLNSPVAIKLMDPEIATHPEALARFNREARAAAALRSPHVVQILDHGVDDGTPYIVMELLEGESLAERLRRTGRLSQEETARVITHIGRAIARAHEASVIHRDLKPDNVFLIENEDEEIAKVLDFGIAKASLPGMGASGGAETRTGAMMGTLHYMSPEQAEGAKSLDFRTDIWAMGVIAYECLVGRRPFEDDNFGALVLAICSRPLPVPSNAGRVPPGFDAWFARACARDPQGRFASAREAAAELRRVCGGDALLEAAPAATTPRLPRPAAGPRPHRRLAFSLAITAILGGAVLAIVLATANRAAPPAGAEAPVTAVAPIAPVPPAPSAPAPVPPKTAALIAPAPPPTAEQPPPPTPTPTTTPPRPSHHHAVKPPAHKAAPSPTAPPPPAKPKVNLGI